MAHKQQISIKIGAFFVLAATISMILALRNDVLFESRDVSKGTDSVIQTVHCRWDRRTFEDGTEVIYAANADDKNEHIAGTLWLALGSISIIFGSISTASSILFLGWNRAKGLKWATMAFAFAAGALAFGAWRSAFYGDNKCATNEDSKVGLSLQAAFTSAFIFLFGAFLELFVDAESHFLSRKRTENVRNSQEQSNKSERRSLSDLVLVEEEPEIVRMQSWRIVSLKVSALSREDTRDIRTPSDISWLCSRFNKLWLITCGFRFHFAQISTISIGRICFWLWCLSLFALSLHLVGNSINSIPIYGSYSIHSGLTTGVFYFMTILLSSRYPFYWKWGLFMIGFDRQMIYHRKCAYLGAICCLLHIFDHRKVLTTWKAQTGWICYGAAVLLLITANNYFRRNHYNGFFIRSHWLFIVVFLVFGWMHNALAIQIGTGFIVIDSIIRAIDLRFRSTKIVGMKLFDYGRVIKLEFKKKHFKYKPGQYVFIRVPAVGLLEFHPFSISSYPGSGRTFSVHIKASVASANGWTSRLMKFMKEHEHKPEHYKDISVQIEGPFGELTLRKELYRYEHVVFIGGGIGVTPLDSLYNQLVTDLLDNQKKRIRKQAKTRKVDFIFTTRSRALITEFASSNKAWEFYGKQSWDDSSTQYDSVSFDPVLPYDQKSISLDENVALPEIPMKRLPSGLKFQIEAEHKSESDSSPCHTLGSKMSWTQTTSPLQEETEANEQLDTDGKVETLENSRNMPPLIFTENLTSDPAPPKDAHLIKAASLSLPPLPIVAESSEEEYESEHQLEESPDGSKASWTRRGSTWKKESNQSSPVREQDHNQEPEKSTCGIRMALVADMALEPMHLENLKDTKTNETSLLTLPTEPTTCVQSDDLPSRTLSPINRTLSPLNRTLSPVKSPFDETSDSLHLSSLDRTVGSDKPMRMSFISSKASMNLIPEFSDERTPNLKEAHAKDLAVASLEIHNSTHITRVKDVNLRREYKNTYPFINFKRPNIRGIIYTAAAATHSKDICVVTSGPKSMINECKRWAAEIGVDVHSEIFEF